MAFITNNSIWDGLTVDEYEKRIQRDLPLLISMDACIWPLFNFFNFKYVRPVHQTSVLFLGTLFYSVALSAVESRSLEDIKEKNEE